MAIDRSAKTLANTADEMLFVIGASSYTDRPFETQVQLIQAIALVAIARALTSENPK